MLTDAYSAEYGHAMGGVVNTVTRSGTNDYHASAFWFFRNRTLDARDHFASVNPPESRHQFGGDLSGPILKDKLFFFLNTEEQLRHFPLVSSIINPTAISGFGANARWSAAVLRTRHPGRLRRSNAPLLMHSCRPFSQPCRVPRTSKRLSARLIGVPLTRTRSAST